MGSGYGGGVGGGGVRVSAYGGRGGQFTVNESGRTAKQDSLEHRIKPLNTP